MATYPHMKAGEAAVWERFLRALPFAATSIDYDVRLGEGAQLPPDVPEWVRNMAWALSTKRVDAVVHTPTAVVLVEVKARASLSAVGQLLSYEVLYRQQFHPTKAMRRLIVAESIAPDMAPVLQTYGIELALV